jgi:hypothetical protein
LHRFSVFVALMTWLLVVAGALVTTRGAIPERVVNPRADWQSALLVLSPMVGFTAANVAVGSMALGAAILLALSLHPQSQHVSGGLAVA